MFGISERPKDASARQIPGKPPAGLMVPFYEVRTFALESLKQLLFVMNIGYHLVAFRPSVGHLS